MIHVLLLASWFSITATRPIDSKDIEMPVLFDPPTVKDAGLVLSFLTNEDRRIRSESAWSLGDSQIGEMNKRLAERLPHESNEWVRADVLHAMGRLSDNPDPFTVVNSLHDDDPSVRVRALWTLGQWRSIDTVSSVAERAAKDDSNDVRITAANTLGSYATSQAEVALVESIKDPAPCVRQESAAGIGSTKELSQDGLKALLEALKDSDPLVRAAAVASLGKVDGFKVAGPVAEMASDNHSFVRKQVAISLRRLNATEYEKTTIGLLTDPDMSVRMEAAATLAVLANPDAINPLIARIDDKDKFVRRAAAKALVDLKMAEYIVPKLIEQFQNESAAARREAAWACGEYRDKTATIPLTVVVRDPDVEASINAIEALGKIADNLAVPTLIGQLKNEMSAKRAKAAWSLGEIRDKRATKPLIPILKDEVFEPRLEAATAAGKINDEPFVEPLIGVLRNVSSEQFQTRAAAAWSLGQIADGRAVGRLQQMVSDKVIPTPFGPVYDHDSVRMNSAIALVKIGRNVANAGKLPAITSFLDKQFDGADAISDTLKECIGECLYMLTGKEHDFEKHKPGRKQYFVRSIDAQD